MPTKPVPINKDIPVPPRLPVKAYGFDRLEVGESIFQPGDLSPKSEATKLRVAASIYKRKHPGWNYRSKQVTEKGKRGSRVWRIS